MALSLVMGLTGSPEGLEKLSSAKELLPALLQRVPDADAEVSRNALTALVNISQVCPHLLGAHVSALLSRSGEESQELLLLYRCVRFPAALLLKPSKWLSTNKPLWR